MAKREGDSSGKRESGDSFEGIAILLMNLTLLCVFVGLSIDWWGKIPAPVPIRHSAEGTPVEWAGAGFWNWFSLPLIGVAVTAFFYLIGGFRKTAERNPWMLSIPRKKTFLALPPEGKRRVVAGAFRRLGLFPIPVNFFLFYGQWVNFEVVQGRSGRFPAWATVVFFVAAGIVLITYLFRVDASIRNEAKRASPD
ncbi:MAG: hypothetical protein ACYTHN_23825 [Planctomycetota bacterium]|jgi:hypothetical protein